jgi:hypothetical protein
MSPGEDSRYGGGRCPDQEACLATVVDEIAETMSTRYAVISDEWSDTTVEVVVHGLYDFDGYTSLLLYWQNLEIVRGVQVRSAATDRIVFALDVDGSAHQLQEMVDLNRKLQAADTLEPHATRLHYRWLSTRKVPGSSAGTQPVRAAAQFSGSASVVEPQGTPTKAVPATLPAPAKAQATSGLPLNYSR